MYQNGINKKAALVPTLLLSALVVTAFQNCSKINMSTVPMNVDSQVSSSIDGADADSVFYTNNKSVNINLSVTTDLLDQVRMSTSPTMSEEKNPWQPVQNKISYDLGDDYAFDGSKDGPKTVYLEFRNSTSDQLANRVYKTVKVFLDTQAPDISGEDILNKGINGLELKKSQRVELKWNVQDRKPASAQVSGLDPAGDTRWGFSRSNDCSEASLFEKSPWKTMNGRTQISWPSADPLDVFYICLFAKDRAGNTNSYLSQPMTSLWSVVAGDNSQGNGSSVNSNKVRFKKPTFLSIKNNGDISVRDYEFQNWRTIHALKNDPSQIIEDSKFPMLGDSNILYDKSGNAYISENGKLYTFKANDPQNPVLIVSSTGTIGGFAIRKYQNTERLVIGHYVSKPVNADPITEAYLFEVPVSILQGLSQPLELNDLKANYKLIGNGVMAPRSTAIPSGVTLSKNDSLDIQFSVGRTVSMTTGNAGEIYLNTLNFSNTDVGSPGIRKLTPKADGKFYQEALAQMTQAGWQISYVKQTSVKDGQVHELLIASEAKPGAAIYDFKLGKRITPFAELKMHYCYGVLIVPNAAKTDYSFYISSATTSQIFHYDSDYKLIEILGRPVFDNLTDPLSAVIGKVDGVVSDTEDGSIYFTDSQNALIRKIDKNGVLSTVAGQVQNTAAKMVYDATPLDEFTFDSSGFIYSFRYQLAADFDASKNRKVLYVPLVSGQVHAIDLVNKSVTTLLNPTNTTINGASPSFWTNDGVAFAKGPGDKNALLVTKIERSTSGRDMSTGYVQMIPVQGSKTWASDFNFMGDINSSAITSTNSVLSNSSVAISSKVPSVSVDSQGYVFVATPYGLRISTLNSTSPQTRTIKINVPNFGLIEEGTKRHLIYFNESLGRLALTTLELNGIFDPTNPSITPVQKLCLPGTSAYKVGQIATDADGNLLITDSANARILKYRIRDASGNLKWSTICPGA